MGRGRNGALASSWGIKDRSRSESAGDGSHVSFLFTRLDSAGTCSAYGTNGALRFLPEFDENAGGEEAGATKASHAVDADSPAAREDSAHRGPFAAPGLFPD